MKRMFLILMLIISSPLLAQNHNMSMYGRWGNGPCQAVTIWGNSFVLTGNGSNLEVYEIQGTLPNIVIDLRATVLLPDLIEDIYVEWPYAYVACDQSGLQIVHLDLFTEIQILGSCNTDGRAMAVFVKENHAYVADDDGGLAIIDVTTPSSPSLRSVFPLSGSGQDVWVDKDTAYVAAGSGGLWTVDVKDPSSPVFMDSLMTGGNTRGIYIQRPKAYLADGNGGMKIVDITYADSLVLSNTWNPGGSTDLSDIYVFLSTVYVTDTQFGVRLIDISGAPAEISSLGTRGDAEKIMINTASTAFLADGGAGLKIIDVRGGALSLIDSVATGDVTTDLLFYEDYVYVAGGRSGLWILDRSGIGGTGTTVAAHMDMFAHCYGIARHDSLLFVADGTDGLAILDLDDPVEPVLLSRIAVNQEALDVDVHPDAEQAVVADGNAGLHLFDYSSPDAPADLGLVALDANVTGKVAVDPQRRLAYAANGNGGVHIVNLDTDNLLATLPVSDARAVDVQPGGTALYVAAGADGIASYNVTDSTNPVENWTYDTQGKAMDVLVYGNTAFVADGEGTVRMVHFSETPREVGVYHTYGVSQSLEATGDTLAVADGETGVYFLKPLHAGTLVSLTDSLHFSTVVVGETRTLSVILLNTGTSFVEISSVNSTSGRFASGESLPKFVSPGDTLWLGIEFTPLTTGEVADMVVINSSATNTPLMVPVKGTGIDVTPIMAYVPDYYTFILYHMNELDGDTLRDESSYGYADGIVTNGYVTTTDGGRFDEALRFEANGKVSVSMDSLYRMPKNEGFTAELWFKLAAVPSGREVLFHIAQNDSLLFEMAVDDTTSGKRGLVIRMVTSDDDTVILASHSTFVLPLNQWLHGAMVLGETTKLYLNGVLMDQGVNPRINTPDSPTMTIGNTSGGGSMFTGWIDEFRMSGVARQSWEFTRVYPDISTSRYEFDFGQLLVGTASQQTLRIYNYGYQTLNITNITKTSSAYSVARTAYQIPLGASVLDTVTFRPTATGVYRDTLVIVNDDPNEPNLRIPMTGTGMTGPNIVAVSNINFGRILLGSTTTYTLNILNNGDQALIIGDINWTDASVTVSDTSFQVPVGETRNVLVTFNPLAEGTMEDNLVISSNDPGQFIWTIEMNGFAGYYRLKQVYVPDAYTIALYHFDETTGNSVLDVSGHGYTGTLMNLAARVDSGYFGKGIHLDGLNDYISIPSTPDLIFEMTSESFTLEGFFRTDSVSQSLFFKDLFGGNEKANYGLMIDSEGKLNLYGFGSGVRNVADGSWHHIAFVYNDDLRTGYVYLDGVMELSQYWTYGNTDTTARGSLILGAREITPGVFTNHFEGDVDEFRISSIARNVWEFAFRGPGISVVSTAVPQAGTAYTLNMRVTPDATNKVTLYYRQGGAHAYSSVTASKIDSVNFRATIPAEAVTIRGVEGYFERKTSTATFTDPMVDPVNNPRTAIVKFTQAASNITLAPREYTMISVPATLDKPKVYHVLHDDLGAVSPSSWRFFTWKDSSYAEYFDTLSTADSTLFRFQKGNAFWVVTAEEKTFDVETGYSTPLDSLYRLNLRPRWNMVSSPFAFPVSWDDCALSSSVLGTLYYYAGATEGYRLDWPVLEPWRGYWICNFGLESETLFIPPRASQVQKGTAPQNGVLYALEEKDWLWQISAKTDRTKDLDNFAGVRDGAMDEWDVKDRAEPPPIGDYLALYFDHRKWESYPGLYGVDIRKPGQQGYIWEFVVESCEQEKNVSLEWTLHNAYPEGWEAYLIDTDEGVSVNMQQTVRYRYTTDPAVPNTHRFKLLVGSPEFVEQASDVPLVPVAFGLSQNYPNPFNPETTIEYSLPKNGQVRLTVYNIIGQQVRVLVDEKQKTGAHKVMWNGTSENGVQVPSGIYIYRLEFPGKVADRKLVLVR